LLAALYAQAPDLRARSKAPIPWPTAVARRRPQRFN
jgi:hypothetical protein